MILVNNPGSWSAMYPPLTHAKWHGWTPTDLVFPFFLFAVGNSLAFVMKGAATSSSAAFWTRVFRRTLLIFLIGLALNASPFVRWNEQNELVMKNWDTLRFLGVLQRIALSFGAAASIVWLCDRGRNRTAVMAVSMFLLIGYWGACRFGGATEDVYSLEGFFGTHIDRWLLGTSHLYRGEGVPFDPEGLASTIPAIAQVLIGWLVGQKIAASRPNLDLIASLCLWSFGLLVTAYVWQWEMPINKKIWTSSFVLLTSGLAISFLCCCIYWLDVYVSPKASDADLHSADSHRGWKWAWASFFEVFGKNPLFIFVLSGLVPRCLDLLRWQVGAKADESPIWMTPLGWLKGLVMSISSDPRLGSLLYSVLLLAVYWLIVFVMDRKHIYVRV
jgi:predicted acyltransferase